MLDQLVVVVDSVPGDRRVTDTGIPVLFEQRGEYLFGVHPYPD